MSKSCNTCVNAVGGVCDIAGEVSGSCCCDEYHERDIVGVGFISSLTEQEVMELFGGMQ